MTTATLPREQRTTRPGLHAALWIARILIGCLFIFSGLVKANDPSGTANKMMEILEKMGMHGMADFDSALKLSVLMIGFEIIAGVATLLGFAFRVFSFLLLLLNIFFLALTAWIYFGDLSGNPVVKECGCFGDCIKISNAETFWKDVILTALALFLFLFRRHVRPLFSKYPNTALFILSVFFAFGMQWWMLEHLPLVDCMPYKVGTDIQTARQAPAGSVTDSFANIYLLKNSVTGATSEFTQDNYPEDSGDTTWEMISYQEKKVRQGVYLDPLIKDFSIKTPGDTADYTNSVLSDPSYKLILFLRHPSSARTDNLPRLKNLFDSAQKAGITCMILYSSSPEEVMEWRSKHNIPGEYYTFDGTASKTAMRSDPGLMLLQGSVIRGKWSHRDYPATVSALGMK